MKKLKYRDRKTFFLTKEEAENSQEWFAVDAEGLTLGRLATIIVNILRGKHSVLFTPHIDCGGGVIVTNAAKVYLSGTKEGSKLYYTHSGKPGKLKKYSLSVMRERKPEFIIMQAVKGMMPKTKLAQAQLKKLKIFAGSTHNMQAQTPTILAV